MKKTRPMHRSSVVGARELVTKCFVFHAREEKNAEVKTAKEPQLCVKHLKRVSIRSTNLAY